MGVGHLARGLALAEAWCARHGEASLATTDVPGFWRERYEEAGCTIVGPDGPEATADWWSVDGYSLGGATAAPAGSRVMIVDDQDRAGTRGHGAIIAVDHNLPAHPERYPGADVVLAGPRYALLPRRAPDHGDRSPTGTLTEARRRLVVVLGGSPDDRALTLGEAIVADPRLDDLDRTFLRGSDDVDRALRQADMAVAAAGTISWELCRAGVPAVLVALVPNQEPVADALHRAGVARRSSPDLDAVVDAVRALASDPNRRIAMAATGRGLVDGHGPRRVVARMRSHLLSVREATMVDAELLLSWSNDPTTRANSFSSDTIGWDEHRAWLATRLADTSKSTLLASDASDQPIGLVRFDRCGPDRAEIGVTLAPVRRGQGLGGALIDAGVRNWYCRNPGDTVDALIKDDNQASVRAFVDADFDDATPGDGSQPAGVLRYARRSR